MMDLLQFPDHFLTIYLSYTALPDIEFLRHSPILISLRYSVSGKTMDSSKLMKALKILFALRWLTRQRDVKR